jgi:hypothetical protein
MPNLYLLDPAPPFAPDKSVAYASFTTKQDCSPRPIPVIYANKLRVGSIVKVEAEGEYSTTATPNLTWGLYLGTHDGTTGTVPTITTDIALSSVITTPSGAAAFHWRMEWRGKVTKTGSAGSMIGTGNLEQGITLTTESTFPIPITAALRTVAINTTIDVCIGVSATYSASSASNTFTTYSLTVQTWGGTA